MTRSHAALVPLVGGGLVLALTATSAARIRDAAHEQSDRRTVWDGVYTDAQAGRGRGLYEQTCLSCHREDLRGDSTAPSLVGESFMFLWGDTKLGELLAKVQKSMPPERPGSLPVQSYLDIIAFILQKNDFPAGSGELGGEPGAAQIVITPKRP